MPVKIIATKVLGSDLNPGDLFSTVGQEYWDRAMDHGSIGERVFIRTNIDAASARDAALPVYKITITLDRGNGHGLDA